MFMLGWFLFTLKDKTELHMGQGFYKFSHKSFLNLLGLNCSKCPSSLLQYKLLKFEFYEQQKIPPALCSVEIPAGWKDENLKHTR